MAGKPYSRDLVILFSAVIIIFLILVSVDFIGGPPDWWTGRYGQKPSDTETGITPDIEGEDSFTIVEETLLDISDTTQEGSSTNLEMTVLENTTSISLSLTWTDDLGSNDELELNVEFEGLTQQTMSSTSGSIVLSLTEPQAGAYSVTVSALDCPGNVGISPVDRDNGNDWTLSATAQRKVVQ
jgi:hypothetical protein